MPELPEVETVRRTLAPELGGKEIISVDVLKEQVIRSPSVQVFSKQLMGCRFAELARRGKYLLLHLAEGLTLVIHLRMTGRLVTALPGELLVPHTHLVLGLAGETQVRFIDPRRFGTVDLIPTPDLDRWPPLLRLGPEPLEPEFTPEVLAGRLQGRQRGIKAALLDQGIVAGIGNIYADEILFTVRLHPSRAAGALTPLEVQRLHQAIQKVLWEGIEHRGTTIRDYVDGHGQQGGFQQKLQVYGNQGSCPVCGGAIQRLRQAGRSSWVCPCCQE